MSSLALRTEVIDMALTDEQRDEVLALHAQGLPRNEIARRTGISAGSVTNICTANHRTFDRSSTKDARAARSVDLAAARLRLAERLDEAANAMLDMIDRPFLVYSFGGRDNTFASKELDSAPVDARRTIVTSAAIVFDKLTKVVETTHEGSLEAESVLDRLEQDMEREFTNTDDAEFAGTP